MPLPLSVLKSFHVGAFIGIRQVVPCFLYLENRCREKFLKIHFLEGYDKNQRMEKEKKQLLKDIKLCVNTQILGTCYSQGL
jgi:hypothetical protein